MSELLPLDPDQLLTTTRSVRKRLDLDRPVPLAIIREALDVALQAPSGSNSQGWHWIVIDDAEKRRQIADLYRKSFASYSSSQHRGDATAKRVASSATYLAEVFDRVPVFVIGAIDVGKGPTGESGWHLGFGAAGRVEFATRAAGPRSRVGLDHAPFGV